MVAFAIQTKYIDPSNTKGSRIKAFDGMRSVTVPYNHALSEYSAHKRAAWEFCKKYHLTGKYTGGALNKGYVFVKSDEWPRNTFEID